MRSIIALLVLGSFCDAAAGSQSTSTGNSNIGSGVVTSKPEATPGFKLFAPLRQEVAVLVDLEGNEVHRWDVGTPPTGAVYLRDNGNILVASRPAENPRFRGGGAGGILQEFSWEGDLVWSYVLADDYQTMHHDFEPLPNGNVLVIAWEHRYAEDVAAAGRHPDGVGEEGLWPDAILEIEPTGSSGGNIVWEWHVWDHLVQDFDETKDRFADVVASPGRLDVNADVRDAPPISEREREQAEELEAQMRALGYVGDDSDAGPDEARETSPNKNPDWLHTNAIDYHPEYELIVLSTPHLNEIWVIDHSTTIDESASSTGGRWKKGGEILWRWGNPQNYGRGTKADQRLFYQHDPQWISGGTPGDLRLIVFNNGRGRPDGDWSSVEEFVLPFDPQRGFDLDEDAPFEPSAPAWTYADSGNFYSAFISGAQRLENGNTVICSGAPGRILEVTPGMEIVWEYYNPYEGGTPDESGGAPAGGGGTPRADQRAALFRATHIDLSHPGLVRL